PSTAGAPSASPSALTSNIFRAAEGEPGRNDSGNLNQASDNAQADSAAATYPGPGPASCPSPGNENDPISGPNVKPNPNAAPISAIPLAPFSGRVQSAMYDW